MSGPPLSLMESSRPCAAWWGKLPSQGDFVGRRVPHALMQSWDAWLRDGIDQLRLEAGAQWAEQFFQSPLWFFMCPASFMGLPMIGVVGPSVDRIGRLFPLTVFAVGDDAKAVLSLNEHIEHFLLEARDALIDARRIPLAAQQLDERVVTLRWPFELPNQSQDQFAISGLLSDLLPLPPAGNSIRLPRVDFRECMEPGSHTSVWWISPTSRHTYDELVQHDVLHRRHFVRLFKGA